MTSTSEFSRGLSISVANVVRISSLMRFSPSDLADMLTTARAARHEAAAKFGAESFEHGCAVGSIRLLMAAA